MLKPVDIHNKEFKRSVRGYDQVEVDEFLDEIMIDYEQMQRELEILRGQLSAYNESMTMYKEREDALNNALVSAQQFADTIKRDAEFAAKKIVEEAKKEAEDIAEETEKKMLNLQERYLELVKKYNTVRSNVCGYLRAQLEMIEENELEEVFTQMVPDEDGNEEEMQETKINEKLKELMDAKIYK